MTDKPIELSRDLVDEVHSWSKDTLRQQFLDLVKAHIKQGAELDRLKNPNRIILPK